MDEMASILAHELNQPLATNSNNVDGSRRLLAEMSYPSLSKIEPAIDHAAEQTIRPIRSSGGLSIWFHVENRFEARRWFGFEKLIANF
jgi:hypothetical protein